MAEKVPFDNDGRLAILTIIRSDQRLGPVGGHCPPGSHRLR